MHNKDNSRRIFFNTWYCENRCPLEIISNRDKLFILKFWKALMKLTRIKHKLSTAYHPETDGVSEHTNKMVIQCLRYHVKCNQKGWAKALPKVHFDIMNTINASMGFSPFILKTGQSPHLLPPLLGNNGKHTESAEEHDACTLIEEIENNVQGAKDSLLTAKIS